MNTPNKKEFKLIADFYQKTITSKSDFFSDFVCDELYCNGEIIERLIKIINKANNSNYSLADLSNIYKLKNNIKPDIHLYIQILNNSALILLIDLYHLSIPADLYINNRLVKKTKLKDLINMYNKYKNCNYNLNAIVKN